MRRVMLALVLLAPAFAGCFGAVEPESTPASAPVAPPLGDPVEVVGGEVIARNETSVTLSWRGSFPAQAIRAASDAFDRPLQLRLPGDVPISVTAAVEWVGTATMGVQIEDSQSVRCRSAGAGGSNRPRGVEGCVVTWAGPVAGDREWVVRVVPNGGTAQTTFEVTVVATALATPALYDIETGPTNKPAVPAATAAGTFGVTTVDYDMGVVLVEDAVTQRPYPVRLLGTAHFPHAGDGPFPVVILMHGRHETCDPGVVSSLPFDLASSSHCRGAEPVVKAVPSHRGYDDVAAILGSHGYVVISVDANDINEQDNARYAGSQNVPRGDDGLAARAKLILDTLDGFRYVHEANGLPLNPELAPLAGRLDLARIGLMGHSRGAEAVTRTPSYAEENGHWSAGAYGAVYSLAGVPRFFLQGFEMPRMPATTAYASVTGYCDGDAWWLGNAEFHDIFAASGESGPLVQLIFMGANHNFYNSEWPQDDAAMTWGNDPYCQPDINDDGLGYGRLSPEDQARHQRVYLPAFFRLYLGGETSLLPLFTGVAAVPAAACPEAFTACPGLVHASYYPPTAARTLIEDSRTDDALTTNDLGGASTFGGFDATEWRDPTAESGTSPIVNYRDVGYAPRLLLAWAKDAVWRTTIPPSASDMSGRDALAFRMAVDHANAPIDMRLVVEDAAGARRSIMVAEHSAALFVPPGVDGQRLVLNQMVIPFSAMGGIDFSRVRAVELQFDGSTPGAVQVAELMALNVS